MEDAKVLGIKAISGGVEAKKERMQTGTGDEDCEKSMHPKNKLFNMCYGS